MQSLTFVLEVTLLAPLVEFATSSSGHVEPRQGLMLGWLGSAVAGLAVVFGAADRAQADYCYGIPMGERGWVNTSEPCAWDHEGETSLVWEKLYFHTSVCQYTGTKSCSGHP